MQHWVFLGIAIVAEVAGTTALKASDGFTRLWPSLFVVAGYTVAFFFLSLSLRHIPVGVAYAIWAGLGVVLIVLSSWLIYGEKLDLAAVVGIAMIVGGVGVLNLVSKVGGH